MDDSTLWTPWRMPYLRGEAKKHYDGCVFCLKATTEDRDGEHIIARSDHVFVTLNLYPYNNGHILIVPYRHAPSLEVLPTEALTDLMLSLNKTLAALREVYNPPAFNVGVNIGAAAGAGIAEHVHMHVVPRWPADTNFMTVVAGTRVIPDTLDSSYRQLREAWEKL